MMLAISLWQPWATLWTMQLKKYETRSWAFPYSAYHKPVAIHAAKKVVNLFKEFDEVGWNTIFRLLKENGLIYEALPRGAIVGTCNRIISKRISSPTTDRTEYDLGDWRKGRHYWIPSGMKMIEPIPYKGRQGVFKIPDEIIYGEAVQRGPVQASLF